MIYTPRCVIDLLIHPENRHQSNKQVCTKIEYRGYEISIAMDSSHGDGDLWRSDIRVFTLPGAAPGADATGTFLEADERMLYGTAETLIRVFKKIDELTGTNKIGRAPRSG
jgi:hypothetical protein